MKNSKQMYYTPSELSQLSGCSRQLLVYYDNEDILKPAYINEHGYRYYHLWQWALLEIILSLRKMEVPLNEIKEYVQNPSPEYLTQLYKNRLTECENQIAKLQHQKQQLEQCIRPLEELPNLELDKLEIINIPAITCVNLRKVCFEDYPKTRINSIAQVLLSTIEESTTNDYLISYGFPVEEFFSNRISCYYVFLKEISPTTTTPLQSYLHFYSRFDHNQVPEATRNNMLAFLQQQGLEAEGQIFICGINSHIFSKLPGQRINEVYLPVKRK